MSVASLTQGVHRGGLLGAGGLVFVLAGCAFLQTHQHESASFVPMSAASGNEQALSNSAPESSHEPESSQELAETQTTALQPEPEDDPVATISSQSLTRPQPQPDMVIERPPEAPAAHTDPVPPSIRPATVQTVPVPPAEIAPTPPQPQTVQAETYPVRRADFIVKFRANSSIDEVISTWRRDREAARARFETWAASDPLFSQMDVSGCSYSGELILSTEIGGGPLPVEAEVDALIERIRNHGAVAYADPDFTAHPGVREN